MLNLFKNMSGQEWYKLYDGHKIKRNITTEKYNVDYFLLWK